MGTDTEVIYYMNYLTSVSVASAFAILQMKLD